MVDGKFSFLNVQNALTLLSKGTRLRFYTPADLNTARATAVFAEIF